MSGHWSIANILTSRFGGTIFADELASIEKFLRDLDFDEVREAMRIACYRISDRRGAFLYFCKICWNKIREEPPTPTGRYDFPELRGGKHDFPELDDG
jgi:hypothetical protein